MCEKENFWVAIVWSGGGGEDRSVCGGVDIGEGGSIDGSATKGSDLVVAAQCEKAEGEEDEDG